MCIRDRGGGGFTIGAFAVDRQTGRGTIDFAYPLRGAAGELRGLLIARFPVEWLASYFPPPSLPGRTLTVTDRHGIVVMRMPGGEGWVGRPLPAPELALTRRNAVGVAELADDQGKDTVYGYVPPPVPPVGLYLTVSADVDAASRAIDSVSLRSDAESLAVTALTFLFTWFIGARLIGRPIGRLLDATQRWQRGDYAARAALSGRRSEFSRLGDAFDAMAERLAIREEQLRTASQAKTTLLAAAGQDLRQPLQYITMALSILSRKPLDANERRHVQRADRAIDKLAEALDTLTDASSLIDRVPEAQLHSFPIRPLLREIGEEWTGRARAKGLRLRVVASRATVTSDPGMLRTIVHNLVANAIKYTASGAVLVGCRHRHGAVVLEVWDTGSGIADQDFDRVFQEFEQAEPGREGYGLGLWIARTMASRLGHAITVRSVVGRGSCFAVELTPSMAAMAVALSLIHI